MKPNIKDMLDKVLDELDAVASLVSYERDGAQGETKTVLRRVTRQIEKSLSEIERELTRMGNENGRSN